MTLGSGQVALVTGGGSGIGRAVATRLAERGMHCVIVGRRAEVVHRTASGLAVAGTAVVADLADRSTWPDVVSAASGVAGRLDLVVHAAGVFDKRYVDETDEDFWDQIVDVDLAAPVGLTRHAWPWLVATRGQVVLVSSVAAIEAFSGNTAYAAAKAGLNAFGRVLDLEGRPHGIRVLTFCPAQTRTEIWSDRAPEHVLARMMPVEGVADVIVKVAETDRSIRFDPIVLRPWEDPWA